MRYLGTKKVRRICDSGSRSEYEAGVFFWLNNHHQQLPRGFRRHMLGGSSETARGYSEWIGGSELGAAILYMM